MTERLAVKNVSVKYLTGDVKNMGLKDYFIKRMKGEYIVHEFWADRDISFSLHDGDMLGIIGTNGAGKSTLLKAVSGILSPSEGTIRRKGKIAALLELSSGFDGDLTVKENTYLRGAMLGYSRAFMNQEYDEIIDFAELQAFQDTPFRQLSSGMKSRLAFSIACLVQPDILILDEVLSVGDGAFRKKSEQKMRSIIANGATTILVSHSISQIRRMCNKVLWLHKGQQIAFGEDVETICLAYNYFLDNKKLPESSSEMAEMARVQRKIEKEEMRQRQNEMIQKAAEIKARRKERAAIRKARKEALEQENREQ
ncbi:MAG: ATP-binding cassette domain-containing protein [Erysipelotrichaceae bacterium]|nr:ATP-binding cassette domain-containing protein [Erysipelotrichaceae bacterium]